MPAKEMGMQGIVVKFRCTMVENTDASWVEIKMFAPIQFWTAALLAHTVAILGREKNCSYMLDHLVSMVTLSLTS